MEDGYRYFRWGLMTLKLEIIFCSRGRFGLDEGNCVTLNNTLGDTVCALTRSVCCILELRCVKRLQSKITPVYYRPTLNQYLV